jgi:hypothetical protein
LIPNKSKEQAFPSYLQIVQLRRGKGKKFMPDQEKKSFPLQPFISDLVFVSMIAQQAVGMLGDGKGT